MFIVFLVDVNFHHRRSFVILGLLAQITRVPIFTVISWSSLKSSLEILPGPILSILPQFSLQPKYYYATQKF